VSPRGQPVSETSPYKKILRHIIKPKVSVKVGRKVEEMTDTQAYRFAELSQGDAAASQASNDGPFERSRYSLEEAAFRLMVDEDEILRRAAAGSVNLYTSAAGFEGRWRRLSDNGDASESSLRTLQRGYLRLTASSCRELAVKKHVDLSLVELPESPVPPALDIDHETLQELSAWGGEKKCFFLHATIRIDRDVVILLAPLTGAG